MKLKLILLIALLTLFVSGCATHQKTPGATFDRIGQEMQGAIGSRAKGADEALSQAMMPPLQLELPDSAKSVEPRFDLAVSNAPASQVFMALVSGTRYSMLIAPEVAGNVTANLKNVTVREALETLRELYGYEFKFQGTRIYIQPNTMQTRIFQINYLAGKRQGQSDVRVTSSSISAIHAPNTGATTPSGGSSVSPAGNSGSTSTSGPPSSQISTTQTSDFWHDLSTALTSIVGNQDGRAVIVSPGSGVVLVKAFPADIRAVENYLRITQVIVERQVMLEAKIIEVALNEEFQAGVNWNHFGGSNNRFAYGTAQPGSVLNTTGRAGFDSSSVAQSGAGAISAPGVGILPGASGIAAATALGKGFVGLAFQSANFAALLNFLETQGNVQVLSSPRIATINNQQAVLKVGTDEFFVTNVSSTVTSSGTSNITTPTITLQPFFSGIALDVTPQIDGETNIVLHIHPSISVVTEKQKIVDLGTLGTYTLPLANSTVNETDSVVRVQDGNIVAIGGLMKQEQSSDANGLPGTTTSSGLGLLFGTRNSYLRKRELVILIKPTIIHNASSWKDDLIETQSRVQQLDPRLARPQPAQ
ncbi:secretin N-terminal domain-containing protein [Propionivibrio sp.]|uniref:secretin N-terminal domain-containing protein n=1 Tax=Propionivibrio sp. TaxID=2212460 RepID=UPI0025FFFCBF|nr:secretin N-terminal domain-containing protein [Propionivibrio sp.]MBK8743326.1 secretin N-terminal domain-containing protein [Propionivibrio sp.]MBK8894650.1 secretin N-terminal domain-containing protein [Propionivibrio sp.]